MNGGSMSLEEEQGHHQQQQDQLHDQSSKEDPNNYLAALQLVQSNRGWEALCLQYTPKLASEKNSGDDSDLSQKEGGRGRPFQCTVCNATYKTRTHLRRHMFIHLSSRPFACTDCGKGFNRKEHLNKHIEAVHSGTKYECGYCGKEISRKDHLNRHIKNMHMSMTCTVTSGPGTGNGNDMLVGNNGILNVPSTQSNFVPPGNLVKVDLPCGSKQKAQLSFLAPQPLQAASKPKMKVEQLQQVKQKAMGSQNSGVGGSSSHAQHLANSLKVTNHFTGNKMLVLQVYSCTECNATFTTEKDFNIHSRTHKPQPYKCSECPRAYTRREKLTEHIRCFHQGQKFTCDYCQKTLSRKDHVLRHVRSVHPEVLANRFVSMAEDMDAQSRSTNFNSSSTSTSSQQGTSVSSAAALGEMNILLRSVCHICLKVFGTSYHLSRHMESCHNGDIRPYNCTACSKQFKRKDHLTKHMKSHCPSFKKMNELETNGIDAIDSLQILMHPDDDIQDAHSKMDLNDLFAVTGDNGKTLDNSHKRVDVTDLYASSGSALESLTNGELSVSAVTMYPCGHCQKEFTDRNKLLLHLQEHDVGVKTLDTHANQGKRNTADISQIFGNSSNSLESLGNGNLSVTMLYPCGHCQKEFTNRDRLIQHLHEHSNKVTEVNNTQDKRQGIPHHQFGNNGNIQSLGSTAVSDPCGHCQREFSDINRLLQHLQEHDANAYASLMETCT